MSKKANLTENGLEVLKRRYLKKDENGNVIETPEDLFFRVANTVAAVEGKYAMAAGGDFMTRERVHERWSELFYDLMINLDFLPNSPTLMNAGRPLGQLSACFVLPIEDSMDGIFTTLKNAAMIHKSGGGTGFSFSRIRPKNSHVHTTGGKASGPISFMHAYNAATGTVAQGGTRRGANMGMLRVDHPDIMEFIKVKEDLKELTNFNLSVAVTEKFMKALETGADYDLHDINTGKVVGTASSKEVFDAIVNSAWKMGEPGVIFIDRVNENNFLKPLYGEIEATNPCVSGATLLTTDKGEIPIKDCVGKLTKIWNGYEWSFVTPKVTGHNLESLIITIDDGKQINCTKYHKFLMCTVERKEAKDLKVGDVLYPWYLPGDVDGRDMESRCIVNIEEGPILDTVYCLEEPIRHTFMANGIVVGNCGEQPLLPYEACNLGSINLANFVMENGTFDFNRLATVTRIATRFLDDVIDANKYPLPEIEKMVMSTRKIGLGVMGFADMLQKMDIAYCSEAAFDLGSQIMKLITTISHSESGILADERGSYPAYNMFTAPDNSIPYRRNAFTTTIAPTGSISAIAGISSGIEPLFSNAFYKHYMDDDWHRIVNESLVERLKKEGYWTEEVEKTIIDTGTIAHIESIPQHIRDVYACAHDISPKAHIMMQASFQKYLDNAISKTINFVSTATPDDIRDAYMLAYKLGCKGLTVYRDGCRDTQVLNVKRETPKALEVKPSKYSIKDLEELLKDVDPGKLITAFNHIHDDRKLRWEFPGVSYIAYSDDITPKGFQDVVNESRPKSLKDKGYTMNLHKIGSGDPIVKNPILLDSYDEDGNFQPAMLRNALEKIRPGIVREMVVSAPDEYITPVLGQIRERPEQLAGTTTKVDINCGKLYLTTNHDEEGRLFEVFSTTGKSGGCPAQSEAVCRLVSLLLRAGVDPEEITRQLCGIKCMACMKNPKIKVLSCPDAIGREIKAAIGRQGDTNQLFLKWKKATEPTYIEQPQLHRAQDLEFKAGEYKPPEIICKKADEIMQKVNKMHVHEVDESILDAHIQACRQSSKAMDEQIEKSLGTDQKDICPQCGAEMKHIGGCKNCLQCGYSSCG